MKELVNAITQATANRLKSPIIGSFLLSWLVVNHNSVLTFIFSNSEQKLELLKQDTPFWTTTPTLLESPVFLFFLYPSVLALVYTFGLPYLQYKIDYHKFRKVDLTRLREKHRNQRAIFKSQKVTSKAQAAPEYWKDKLTRDLNNWDQQREGLLSDRDALRVDRDNVLTDRDSIQEQLMQTRDEVKQVSIESDRLKTENQTLTAQVNTYVPKIELLEQQAKHSDTALESMVKEVEQRNALVTSLQKQQKLFESVEGEVVSLRQRVKQFEENKINQSEQVAVYERQVEKLSTDFTDLFNISQEVIDNLTSVAFQEHVYESVGIESQVARNALQIEIYRAIQPMVETRDLKHPFKRLEDIRIKAKIKNDENYALAD
ncbi:hypothetical protein [Vibrio splendidus]|uniref:hypothetical protein n=1 Tax=Vibrio splendidus TaxID=29497 RepID=UPI000C856CF3|nr:hypothetical protein [Vibrio splendidus]PMP40835.1 hypothetical protein BCS86_17880 [Vibrio splendidus]